MYKDSGFTLIETLAALLILSSIVAPVLGLLNQSMLLSSDAGSSTRVYYLAAGNMELLKGLDYDELKNFIGGEKAWQKAELELDWVDKGQEIEFYFYYEVLEDETILLLDDDLDDDNLEEDEKENLEKRKLVLVKVKASWFSGQVNKNKEYILQTFKSFKIPLDIGD